MMADSRYGRSEPGPLPRCLICGGIVLPVVVGRDERLRLESCSSRTGSGERPSDAKVGKRRSDGANDEPISLTRAVMMKPPIPTLCQFPRPLGREVERLALAESESALRSALRSELRSALRSGSELGLGSELVCPLRH